MRFFRRDIRPPNGNLVFLLLATGITSRVPNILRWLDSPSKYNFVIFYRILDPFLWPDVFQDIAFQLLRASTTEETLLFFPELEKTLSIHAI
jgi:hypothetical protein